MKSLLYILAILLCTTVGQRDQILLNVNIDLMMFEAVKVNIFESEFLKQSRSGYHRGSILLLRYPDQKICVVMHIEEYIA